MNWGKFGLFAGGVLFARFEKPDAGDDYADVSMPTLTLEGRVQ